MHANASPSTLPIRLAVDLSNLRPGGENGGIKPFLFETLLWLGRQNRAPLQIFYLTCSSTHAEVRDQLARMGDEVICVRHNDGTLPRGDGCAPRERLCVPPPADLLWQLGARVLYCPFGQPEFATPGICTICTVVDVLHRDFPWSLSPHHNAARERAFQEIVAVADRLQCISHHVAGRMREHYGVPDERMFTTHIAVHQRFAALSAAAPASSGNGRNGHGGSPAFFFYPANAWKHKNHETLLLAYGIYRAGALADGAVPWPLVLTGHEDERWEEMRALARTLGLLEEGSVSFLGYLAPGEFGRLWETAGALVFPSLHEGFGIPLLEAMQHDLPVLTSRDGSLPEVGADACLYTDVRRPEVLAAEMTRMAADDDLRASLVAAGRRRLADFSFDRESTHLLDAIIELSRTAPPYRPFAHGIFLDGWTEGTALLALPGSPVDPSARGRLTLRFRPMPVARRLRLRAGSKNALGSFGLLARQAKQEISVDFRPAGGALNLEIPDAANLNAGDARTHGVQLLSADLRMADGREYPLFPAP